MKRTLAEKILVEFIEADVETGFALVDDAKLFRASGQLALSGRALHDAEDAVSDIERRLQQLGASDAGLFHLLVTELRNEIAAAQRGTC